MTLLNKNPGCPGRGYNNCTAEALAKDMAKQCSDEDEEDQDHQGAADFYGSDNFSHFLSLIPTL